MKKILFCYFILINCQVFAQSNNNTSKNLFYVPTRPIALEKFYDFYLETFDIQKNNTFEHKKSHHNDHQKYQQYYKGILVKNGISILHLNNGLVDKSSGNIYNINIDEVTPRLSENKVKDLVKHLFHIQKNTKTQDLEFKVSTVICNENYPADHGNFVPAYEVIVESPSKFMKEHYIINGLNGHLIFQQNLMHSHSVPGKGKTFHYGEKTFMVDSINPTTYNLFDKERNITSQFGSETATNVATDADNYWEYEYKDASVIDAHYCTSKFHDMMKNRFNYVGIDGNHGAMNPIILSEKGLVNAFWTGDYAVFGRGDCHYGPLATLAIVAHEFTHGVTQYNSNLIYNLESGAINEALSDVFGKALEKFEDPANFSWLVDAKISEDDEAEPFRSMEDPKAYNCPAMYKGELWLDNADVHTNSSILNHWFYIMIDGKSGTNENGESFQVSPQPIQDVLDILFLCQTSYLTESSNYNDLCEFTKEICKNKFGENSEIYLALIDAWKAVGLPYEDTSNNVNFDLEMRGIQSLDFKVCSTVGESIDISVEIENHGKVLTSGTPLTIYVDDIIFETSLNKDLQQGEKTTLVIEDAYDIIDYGFQFFSLRMEIEDENIDNNYSYSYFYALSNEPDLAMSFASFNVGDCQSSKVSLSTSLMNNSCSENFNGELIYIDFLDLNYNLLHSMPLSIPVTIEPGETYNFSEEIDADIFGLNKDLYVAINTAKDNYEVNDLTYTPFQRSFVNSNIYYDFDNGGFDDFIINGSFETGFDYNGESYFLAESNFSEDPCKNLIDQNIALILSGCLDVSQFAAPQMEFDLLQFHNNSITEADLLKNSNVIEIKLSKNGQLVESKILNEFVEGSKMHKTIQIPAGFKGKIEMNFYLAYRRDFFADVEEADIVLIDNFTIHDIVKTEDLSFSDNYKIYPNPANDFLHIEGNTVFDYEIFDLNGKLAGKGHSNGLVEKINVSAYQSGSYLIRLKSHDHVNYFKFTKF